MKSSGVLAFMPASPSQLLRCEVVTRNPDIESVFHGIRSPMLDVGTQMFMGHKQDLSALDRRTGLPF